MTTQKYAIINDVTNETQLLTKTELIKFGFSREERDTLINFGFVKGWRLKSTKFDFVPQQKINTEKLFIQNILSAEIETIDRAKAWFELGLMHDALAQGLSYQDWRAINYKELNQQAQNEHYKFVKRETIKNQMRDLIKTRDEANAQLIELQNELAKYR